MMARRMEARRNAMNGQAEMVELSFCIVPMRESPLHVMPVWTLPMAIICVLWILMTPLNLNWLKPLCEPRNVMMRR